MDERSAQVIDRATNMNSTECTLKGVSAELEVRVYRKIKSKES